MTTKGPATEGRLGDLHSKVAEVIIGALDVFDVRQAAFIEGHENGDEGLIAPEVNPALLSVAVRFLDANKITCAPEAGNTMSELEQRLAAKRARKLKVVGGVDHTNDDE